MTQDFSLPDSWKWVKLDEISELSGGGTPSRENPEYFTGNIVWLTPTEIPKNRVSVINSSKEMITQQALKNSSARLLPKGTVLMTSRASIGYVAIAGTEVTTNQGFASFFCKESIYNFYLAYWLFGNADLFKQEATGTTFKEISKSKLRTFSIPLPPLLEQERIVAKIEELFTQLDAGTAALRRVQAELKRYKASVLKAACEGRLVEQDPSDEPAEGMLRRLGKLPLTGNELSSLPKGWSWTTTGLLCDCIVPNRDKPKTFTGNIPWITLPDFDDGIEIGESKSGLGLSKDEVQMYKARIIPRGSVIMSCIGHFGITAVAKKDLVVNQQLHAFLVREDFLNAQYLAYAIRTQIPYMEKIATATTISYLNKANCNSVPIPFPPLAEQRRIVSEIERRLSVVAEVEGTIAAMLARSARLRQAILKQAFEGKLVVQNPED